jgi:hypothetical protein
MSYSQKLDSALSKATVTALVRPIVTPITKTLTGPWAISIMVYVNIGALTLFRLFPEAAPQVHVHI